MAEFRQVMPVIRSVADIPVWVVENGRKDRESAVRYVRKHANAEDVDLLIDALDLRMADTWE